MEKFKFDSDKDKLGEGTYGIVHRALNEETGKLVALKRIRLESVEEGVPCTAIREIGLLIELDHPNIVKLEEIISDETSLTLVFEYCDLDLKKYLDKYNGFIRPSVMKSFLYQLLLGVAYCHEVHILHRDIKPQNLLININTLELKIADFGLARAFTVPSRTYSSEVVTLWYRPPDVLLGSQTYDTKIDLWSIGCVFSEMASGKALFPGHSAQDQLLKIFRILGTPNGDTNPDLLNLPEWDPQFPVFRGKNIKNIIQGLSPEGYELLNNFLQYDPSKRITAKDALSHKFFEGMIINNKTT
jgi:cyclin-dependent kinase